ncbi:MAG: flagellar protein FlgN [bacterium]|nr:flagellar protein FlgN [bacterium]
MVNSAESTHMAELADTLWYERRLLEYLLFKLVSANLVLIADDRRFVGPAIAEVDAVMAEIRRAEEQRSGVVADVARQFSVSPSAVSLAFLVDNATDSLRATFEDHQAVFMNLVGEIEILTRENRRLATVALDGIQGTLGFAGGDIYDAAGRATRTPDHPIRVNRVL